MKDPAFLFYPNDWIGGTMGMTFEEKGAYMELLMAQFNRGHMTEHMIGQIVGQLWVNIKDKFIKDEAGLFYNKRLDEEKEKRKAFTESRRNNISGTNQFTKKEAHKKGHMTEHMENGNGNVIVNVIGYLNSKAGKNFSSKTKATIKFINARLNDGYTEQQLKDVIDIKCGKWLCDPKMCDYVRPETLFGNKFESYLNEIRQDNKQQLAR